MSQVRVARRNKIIAGLQEAVAFVRGDALHCPECGATDGGGCGACPEPAPPTLTFSTVTGLDIGWAVDLSQDPRLRLLAESVKSQQDAGFGTHIDLRQIPCACCAAPGFNSGWGYVRFTCGAELLNDDEGSWSKPCPHRGQTPPRPAEAGD